MYCPRHMATLHALRPFSLIQAGVVEVVYPTKIEVPERWQKDFDMSTSMMKEAGINIRQA